MNRAAEAELRRVVRELHEENRRWHQRFKQAPIGMAIVDVNGRYVEVNDVLGALLGRPAEDLVGLSIAEVTHPEDREQDADEIRRALAGGSDCVPGTKRHLRPG